MSRAATADPSLLLDNQLCFLVYRLHRGITDLYRPVLAELGLTYPQYLVMLALWEADGITVGGLGERVALDSGTLTPLLKRLEASGLVQRLRDAGDERRVLLRLSAAGRALERCALAVPEAVVRATGCDLAEVSALAARLTALRERLTQATPHAA